MILLERFTFWHRCQGEAESIDQFVTELRKIYNNCEYKDENLIRDQLVFGVRDRTLRKKLLADDVDKLTLQKALASCRSSETTDYQAGEMEKSSKIHAVTRSYGSKNSGHKSKSPHSSAATVAIRMD